MVCASLKPTSAALVDCCGSEALLSPRDPLGQDTMGAQWARKSHIEKNCRYYGLHEEIPLGWEKLSVLI
jgi:hypothetical protein